jgi:hypothetical protein
MHSSADCWTVQENDTDDCYSDSDESYQESDADNCYSNSDGVSCTEEFPESWDEQSGVPRIAKL